MTDHKLKSFDTLINLTQNRVDEAGGKLGKLMSERNNAARQLEMLKEYRKDYADRLNQAGGSGITASNYHNFTRFLATLDEAILQQTKIMVHLDHDISISKEHWRGEQRRLHSYETLKSRREQQHLAYQNRREQILTAEL